ncbi:MAG: type II toxin-antitoxin system RelE/ParE family toxin [Oricola sp.]
MIKSFADAATEDVYNGKCPAGFPSNILKVARRKLAMVDAAADLKDLKSPPGNKLHPLENDRAGQHAIWINSKYRVCFEWREGDAHKVEITDYH